MSSTLKFEGKDVTLDLKPGTQYRLAKAGYSFPDSFSRADTAMLAATELLRICSKTELTSEEIADSLDSYEPLTNAVLALIDEEEAKLAPEKGTEQTKVS